MEVEAEQSLAFLGAAVEEEEEEEEGLLARLQPEKVTEVAEEVEDLVVAEYGH